MTEARGSLRQEYHDQLDKLRDDVVRLGAMTSETIGKGTAVLLDRDLGGAQRLIDGDDVIDALTAEIEETCCNLLALQAPMASELRFLLTTMRVISELERSADLMVNVCKASRRVYDLDFGPRLRGLLEQMGVEAAFLIRAAIDAYVDADVSLALALDDIDDRLDDLQTAYVEAIFESHRSENLTLQSAVQLALIGRYYERIGDHAVNIGERVVYMVTGGLPEAVLAGRVEPTGAAEPSRSQDPDGPGAVAAPEAGPNGAGADGSG
jgi:phosphate transport system protein